MHIDSLFQVLGMATVLAPVALLAAVGMPMLLGFPLSERNTARWTQAAVLGGLAAAVGVLVLMLLKGTRDVPVELGDWLVLPQEHFHFHLSFAFDRLSVPFAILSYALVGTIGAFASRYLHRESGYNRFFLLNAVFLLGMIVASVAATIETLFCGWELVGLSSALLVAYFHERTAPVVNGQRVWSVYRVSDAAFLIAALAMHHLRGGGNFAAMMGQGDWPDVHAASSVAWTPGETLFVGLLLLVAVAGKSGLIPFSGWLPRAMEGPTPSSAIFYGALSVHLGAFLLLRISPILEQSLLLSAAVVLLGLGTAVFAALSGRVQSDVKSALAYASLTQVGIITAEIGLGLRYIPLVHIIGHACLRTLQLVRAPNLLHDYHTLENAIGAHLPRQPGWLERWVRERSRTRLYRLALERGYLDALINEYVVRPFVAVFRWCDRMERRWTDGLSRTRSPDSDPAASTAPAEETP